jgi:signal recognition particle subunit SRP54
MLTKHLFSLYPRYRSFVAVQSFLKTQSSNLIGTHHHQPYRFYAATKQATGMFSSITNRLTSAFRELNSKKTLTTTDVNNVMQEVRIALINADVALPVANKIVDEVTKQAIGEVVVGTDRKAAVIYAIVQKKLCEILGEEPAKLEFMKDEIANTITPPYNLLMTGIQGSGKTTTSAKLALYLKNRNFKVLLVSLDTHRPAARDQLEKLAQQIQVDSLNIISDEKPHQIAERALQRAKDGGYHVCIFDTAGRMQIDEQLMTELEQISQIVNPIETILCADAMLGNEAVNIAQEFHERFRLSGIIMSRLDGDVRGGAAISMRASTGVPIKFVGIGERLEDLDPFVPEGLAIRILGGADIGTIAQKSQGVLDEDLHFNSLRGRKLTFNDYIDQLKRMQKLGSIKSLMDKVGVGGAKGADLQIDYIQDMIDLHNEIIQHCTPEEKEDPQLLKSSASRRLALAKKANVQVVEINKLLKNLDRLQDIVNKMSQIAEKMKASGQTINNENIIRAVSQDPSTQSFFAPQQKIVKRRVYRH